MNKFLVLIFMLLIFNPSFAGGGWPQPKKQGYFKLSQNFIRSPYYFNPDGEIIDITTISLYTSSLYGEYGITNRLTGILYFPFFVRNTLNEVQYNQTGKVEPGDSFNSVGDTDISFKYGIIMNKPV